MIAALARAGAALDRDDFVVAAARAADFILSHMTTPDGRLYRRRREGENAHAGYLEDYAYLVWGLIELYEAGFDVAHLEAAVRLNGRMLEFFWDDELGGLYFSGADNETLVARSKEIFDGATPSGNSVAALNLLRLGRLTGRPELEEKAAALLQAFSGQVAQQPMVFTHYLAAVDFGLGPTQGNRSGRSGRPARGPGSAGGRAGPLSAQQGPAAPPRRPGRTGPPGRPGPVRGKHGLGGRPTGPVRLPGLRLPEAHHRPGRPGPDSGRTGRPGLTLTAPNAGPELGPAPGRPYAPRRKN